MSHTLKHGNANIEMLTLHRHLMYWYLVIQDNRYDYGFV